MFVKCILLLLPLSVGASAYPNPRTAPLLYAQTLWNKVSDGINAGQGYLHVLKETCTADVTFENPVGTPLIKGREACADLSAWGKIHYIYYHVHDAIFPQNSNEMAVYMHIALHMNDCYMNFPSIVTLRFEGDKIASLVMIWDMANVCGSAAPWSRNSRDLLDYTRGQIAEVDAAVTNRDAGALRRLLTDGFTSDATIESPVGNKPMDASQTADFIQKSGMTSYSHGVIDTIRSPTSPNTVAIYTIVTASFGDCSISFSDIVIWNMDGDKVAKQRSYWDDRVMAKCAKAKKDL